LVGSDIEFAPALPRDLQQLLCSVQTWMAGSIKFTLEYDQPFWRKKGYSGMLFSHVGIVTEMYDHTNDEGDKYGFTGFLNPAAVSYTQKVRKQYVLQQLTELLGSEAGDPVAYFDKIWNDDTILGNNPMIHRPHFNNGHPLFQRFYMNGKLLFSGTETAEQHSGYMEGAVCSAKRVLSQLIS
jgi:monoamine oxidase